MRRLAVLTLMATLSLCGSAAAATLNSTFGSGNEGWKTVGTTDCSTATSPATWAATGGNPGGRITGTDSAPNPQDEESCQWYAIPPVSGNLKANYGGTISYDVRRPGLNTFANAEIVIDDDDGTRLIARTTLPETGDAWATAPFTISEAGEQWTFYNPNTGAFRLATKADFFDVLSDVTVVRFNADFRNGGSGGEVTDIDNGILTEASPARDEDADGVANAADNCPLQAGPNNGCAAGAGGGGGGGADGDAACEAAKKKLAKAKAKLKKLRQEDAGTQQIQQAKKKVRKAKAKVKEACAA